MKHGHHRRRSREPGRPSTGMATQRGGQDYNISTRAALFHYTVAALRHALKLGFKLEIERGARP